MFYKGNKEWMPLAEDELGILLVLAEEELVAVDLSSEDMKMIPLPYLASLHASAVTCSYHASGVRDVLYELLKETGHLQIKDMYSNKVRSNEIWFRNGFS